jgi:exonuclease III
MRILTWNCNGAFRSKFQLLDQFKADVLIIQECENPHQSLPLYREWAGEHVWIGRLPYKGLGIFARNGHRLQRLHWPDAGASFFLPVLVDDDLQLVGVWTQSARKTAENYVGQLGLYLLQNLDWFNERTVMAGDFNSNTKLDRPKAKWTHARCAFDLQSGGLVSLYHQSTGEHHGGETCPTFFLHRDRAKPFHIDYAFAHRSLILDRGSQVLIGLPEQWLDHSDHMPLVFEI